MSDGTFETIFEQGRLATCQITVNVSTNKDVERHDTDPRQTIHRQPIFPSRKTHNPDIAHMQIEQPAPKATQLWTRKDAYSKHDTDPH